MKKAFNPEDLQKEIERLKSEGKMPSVEQFLGALALQKEIERLKSEGRMPSMEQFLGVLASAKKQQKKAGDDQPKKDQQ